MIFEKVLLFLFIAVFAVFAQDFENLTLTDCIKIAQKNSLLLESSRLSERTAESALGQAKNERFPNLRGNVSQSVRDYPLRDSSARSYDLSVGLNSSMPIFTAGRISHSILQADYRNQATKLSTEQTARNVSEQVIRAYMQVWSLSEALNSSTDALNLSNKMLARDSILFNSGSFTTSDLALAFAQAAGDSLNLLQAQNNLTQSYTALRQLLEIPLGTMFSLAPPDSFYPSSVQDYEALLTKAKQNSLDLKIDSLSVLAAEEAIGIASAAKYPSLSLTGSLGTGLAWERKEPKYGEQVKNALSYTVSLGLVVPIVDWGSAQHGVLLAQTAKEQAQIAAINSKKQLENTIEQLTLQVNTYRLQWDVSAIQLDAQKTALDKAVQQHQLGMLDISSLIQQQTMYNNAQIKHNQAKYNYLLGRSLLELYIGELN